MGDERSRIWLAIPPSCVGVPPAYPFSVELRLTPNFSRPRFHPMESSQRFPSNLTSFQLVPRVHWTYALEEREVRMDLIKDLGYDVDSDQVKKAREHAERVQVKTRKMRDGSYQSSVYVNGDFYASARGSDRDRTVEEANHYAAQIEFDEWGNW